METLVVATWNMPPDTLSGIQAGLHPRLDYLDLAERLSADWVDYSATAGHFALQRVEDILRLDLRLAAEVNRRVHRRGYVIVLSQSERVGVPLALTLGRRVRHAHLLITVSEYARRQIARYSRFPADRIVPVHHAPTPDLRRVTEAARLAEVRARLQVPERFVLADGCAVGFRLITCGGSVSAAGVLAAWDDGHSVVWEGDMIDSARTNLSASAFVNRSTVSVCRTS